MPAPRVPAFVARQDLSTRGLTTSGGRVRRGEGHLRRFRRWAAAAARAAHAHRAAPHEQRRLLDHRDQAEQPEREDQGRGSHRVRLELFALRGLAADTRARAENSAGWAAVLARARGQAARDPEPLLRAALAYFGGEGAQADRFVAADARLNLACAAASSVLATCSAARRRPWRCSAAASEHQNRRNQGSQHFNGRAAPRSHSS